MKQDINNIIKIGRNLLEEVFKSKSDSNNENNEKRHYYLTRIDSIYNLFFQESTPDRYLVNIKEETIDCYYYKSEYIGNFNSAFSLRITLFQAFIDDLESGLLNTLTNTISLELFDNMIDQAQELRENDTESTNRCACVLTRIVLEDTLKKMCASNNIELKSDKANEANQELKRINVYPNARFKQIESWLAICNSAAHPGEDFLAIKPQELDQMISNVKEFAINNLS